MIDNKLIKSALALTGKTMEDMNQYTLIAYIPRPEYKFSIEKFGWYLLSKPFLREYEPYYGIQFKDSMMHRVGHAFQEAITAYQDGNSKLLVDLLEKLV